VLGAVKDRRRTIDGFVDDEIGRLELMMEDFLAMEGQVRRSVTGFLTDGKSIEFYQLSFDPNRRFVSTPTYSLAAEGADALVSLLKASCEQLDLPPRSVTIRGDDQRKRIEVELERGLGQGTSAVVYAGGIGGEKVVVKCFKDPASMEVESEMLERLEGLAVPRLIDRGDRILVESPIGHPAILWRVRICLVLLGQTGVESVFAMFVCLLSTVWHNPKCWVMYSVTLVMYRDERYFVTELSGCPEYPCFLPAVSV
jgi:hypothetical protein